MKIRFATIAALCAAIALVGADTVAAQDRTFLCDKIDGLIVSAPDWRPRPDGYANIKILITYKSGNELSGVPTNAGFSIAVFGKEHLETYVVNVSTLELLHTATRAGSATFPNAMKSFRGVCAPAGNLAR